MRLGPSAPTRAPLDKFGITLGSVGEYPGITLGSHWDCFVTFIVFWNVLLQDSVDLANRCRYLVPTKEEYKDVKEELMKWTQTQVMFSGYEDIEYIYNDSGEILDEIIHKDPFKYYKRKKKTGPL